MLTVWNDCICNPKKGNAPIGDGPFLLTKFDRGSGITLEKNTRGWYGKPAKLSSIVFRFITNTNSEIQAIRGGEVDAIYPQPQLALADLKGQAGLQIQTHLGLSWEHIEIQQGAKGNPLAKQTVAPPGPDHRAQPHGGGEGAVRHAQPEGRRAEQPRSPDERAGLQPQELQRSGTTTRPRSRT